MPEDSTTLVKTVQNYIIHLYTGIKEPNLPSKVPLHSKKVGFGLVYLHMYHYTHWQSAAAPGIERGSCLTAELRAHVELSVKG